MLPSGKMQGKEDGHMPFGGLVQQIQGTIDVVSQYVELHFPVSIEVLILLIPFLVGLLRVIIPPLKESTKKRVSEVSQLVTRDIVSHSFAQYRVSGSLAQDRNALLQNAIFMYLVRSVWVKKPLPASVWHNICSVFLLIDPFRSRVYENTCSPFYTRSSSSDDDDEDLAVTNVSRSTSHLNRLVLIKLPTSNHWVPIGVDGIEITYNRSRTRVDKSQAVKRVVCLRAYGKDGAERIEQFVQKALSFYINELPNITRSSRHFLELQPSDDGSSLLFKRYAMADDKNLNTVFFPERERVMKLIDSFLFQQGRFAIEGFPCKLGFLLHGPHGCGKTAFVKALAAYTGRHVVSVPLQFLKTNQQLYDIFLNRTYSCVGESGEQRLNMNEVIFFIDGADSSNPLVCSRQTKRTVRIRKPAALTASEEAEALIDNSFEECTVKIPSREPPNQSSKYMGFGSDALEGGTDMKIPIKRSIFSMFEAADVLDLSGLLNVLDGVVDTPGRIIVMSTSNPEVLDPALIRPGRISFKIRMDYIRFDALVEMAGLHYGEVDPPSVSVAEIMEQMEDSYHPQKVRERPDASAKDKQMNFFKADHEDASAEAEAEAFPIPVGAAMARIPLRQLSPPQVEKLRHAIAVLEEERNHKHNFHIAPAEIELLCAECDTLDAFMEALSAVIKGERVI